MPRCPADFEADLVRVTPLPYDFILDLWLLTHKDLRQTVRIPAFLDFPAEALAKEAPLLESLDRDQSGPISPTSGGG